MVTDDREAKLQRERIQKALNECRYKVGDVVETNVSVTALHIRGGRSRVQALPGWKWRIVEVVVNPISLVIRFEVVAHEVPKYYRQELKPNQVAKKVGEYKGK